MPQFAKAVAEEREREASGRPRRVDIRAIKRAERIRRLANQPLETVLKTENKTILTHLMDKMEAVAEATEADILEAEKEAAKVDEETARAEHEAVKGGKSEAKTEDGPDEADKENIPDNELLTPNKDVGEVS